MPTVTWTVPPSILLNNHLNDETPQAVTDYLAGQVPPITATKVDIIGDPYRLVVSADADPTAALNAYTGQPTNERDRLNKAWDLTLTYRDKVLAKGAAATEPEKALAAAIILIEQLARSD
jgi:hypothetical protein